nr:MAG TPA_asm: hypothetical protein [Caudoviricetes sp.]
MSRSDYQRAERAIFGDISPGITRSAFFLLILHSQRRISPKSRVVFRGYNNANANGGVAYSNANNDASGSWSNVGSRLNNNR